MINIEQLENIQTKRRKILNSLFKKYFIYLFLERGEERRETSMCGCLSGTPHWGPGLQPRHVP